MGFFSPSTTKNYEENGKHKPAPSKKAVAKKVAVKAASKAKNKAADVRRADPGNRCPGLSCNRSINPRREMACSRCLRNPSRHFSRAWIRNNITGDDD